MARYITVAEVRATSGVASTLINDVDMEQLIVSAEYSIERLLNTSFTPATVIEQHTGDNSERLVVNRNPLLKIRALQIDDTEVTVEYTRDDKQGGIVYLTTSSELGYFKKKSSENKLVRIKYDYGQLDATTTQTTSSAATVIGTAVNVTVADSSNFTADDYVEIEGMDSQREVFKISSVTDSTTIVADTLTRPHESSSLLTKLEVPPVVLRLMQVGCSLGAVARIVGQSFDEITGYTIGDEQVQKGEPYTQWRETATQLRKEYYEILKGLRTRPSIS